MTGKGVLDESANAWNKTGVVVKKEAVKEIVASIKMT